MIYQEVLDRTSYVPTENMSNEEWLGHRRSFIGGSDAGAVMGLSTYGSPLTVYLEKKNMAHVEENDAMLRGSIMEPYIRQLTQRAFPYLQIEEAPYIFCSQVNPFMGANVDGFILIDEAKLKADADFQALISGKEAGVKGLGIFEAKSSQSGYGFGNNELPDSYYAQVQHYLSVDDLQWALLTVYIIDKNKIRHYIILRDVEFITRMVSEEKDFYDNFLIPGVMPAPMGLESEEDLITGMFEGSESTIVLGEAEKMLCSDYLEISASIKMFEEKKKAISNALKVTLLEKTKQPGKEMKIGAIAGKFNISWSRYESKRVDTEALKKAGLYEQYSKKIETGRFTVTEKKAS